MKKQKLLMLAAVILAVLAGPAMADLPEPSGTNPQTGVGWADGDLYRLAFVTSSNPGGATDPNILHYNDVVQTLANAAGLGDATWYCIGSTADIDARDNTSTNPEDPDDPNCPIFLVDGSTLVAIDNPDLWDGEIAHIIDQSETGGAEYPHLWAFTGTYLDGTKVQGQAPTTGGPLGTASQVSQGNGSLTTTWIWRINTGDPPALTHPLYAMSEALAVGGIDPTNPEGGKLLTLTLTPDNRFETPSPEANLWLSYLYMAKGEPLMAAEHLEKGLTERLDAEFNRRQRA